MDGNPDFLFTSLNNFFECNMWRGYAQHRGTHKQRKWFQWVYIAAFNGTDDGGNQIESHCQTLRFKIGKAQNLRVRGKALIVESGGQTLEETLGQEPNEWEETPDEEEANETKQEENVKKKINWSKEIVYAFSVPRPLMFETRIKRFLYNFIYKDLEYEGHKVQYASEIVQGISFEALVTVIQLCILEGCLYHKYIKLNDEEQLFREYVGDIMKYPPDTIEWDGNTYYGRKWGYSQTMTLKLNESVQQTVLSTLASKDVNRRLQHIQVGDSKFNLMKDVLAVDDVNEPKFVQYVFNVKKNDSRMNPANIPSNGPSQLSFYTDPGYAPNKSFVVGNLAFATYEREKDGKFPCEIVGYWNGQFVVRWIDPRRFDTVDRKWIVFDSEAHQKYLDKGTLGQLSDFLKDEVVAIGNTYLNEPFTGYRYRDYIEDMNGTPPWANQPTGVLVPISYHRVAEDYKTPDQLKTWKAMDYESAFAPSRHWKTGNPKGGNKPINKIFQDQTKEQLDKLEYEIEQGQIEQVKTTYNIHENNQDDSQEKVDNKELKEGDAIRFLREFYIGKKKVAVNSKGIFKKKVRNGYRVKIEGDDTENKYRLIGENNMVVSRTGSFGCTAIVNEDRKDVEIVDCNRKEK